RQGARPVGLPERRSHGGGVRVVDPQEGAVREHDLVRVSIGRLDMVRPCRFGWTPPDSDHSLRHFFPRKRETAKLDGLPLANGMAANDTRMNRAKPVIVDVRMQEAARIVTRKRKPIYRTKCIHRQPPRTERWGLTAAQRTLE